MNDCRSRKSHSSVMGYFAKRLLDEPIAKRHTTLAVAMTYSPFASVCYIVLTSRKKGKWQRLPLAGIPDDALEN